MDRNEAASVIRKYLTCTDITHSCNGKCKACRYHTNDDEKELALRLAIAALDDKDINVPTTWIPVSESLPEEGRDVLITKEPFKIKGYENDVITAKRSVDPRSGKIEWWSAFGALTDKSVLAWMSKPSPWKGEQQ